MNLIKKSIVSFFFIILFTSNSFAFGGTIKGGWQLFKSAPQILKGIKSFSSGAKSIGAAKAGKLGAGAGLFDNAAKEATKLKKLDSSLFSKIDDAEHFNVVRSMNKSDDIILAENNINSSIASTKENYNSNFQVFYNTHAGIRLGRLEAKYEPKNQVYVCNISNNYYYFILLPKKKITILTKTSNSNYPKQILKIIESNAKHTIVSTTKSINGVNGNFVFLPNYSVGYSTGKFDFEKTLTGGSCAVATNEIATGSKLVRYTKDLKGDVVTVDIQKTKVFGSFTFYVLLVYLSYIILSTFWQKKIDLDPIKYSNFLFISNLVWPFILCITLIIFVLSLLGLNFPLYFNIILICLIVYNFFLSLSLVKSGWLHLKRIKEYQIIYKTILKVRLVGYLFIGIPTLLYVSLILLFFM